MTQQVQEYIKFKREFLRVANELGFDGETKQHTDAILKNVFETNTDQDAYYFSDMVSLAETPLQEFIIEDSKQFTVRAVDFTKLNEKAILVYLDGEQLIKDQDYTIDPDAFIELKIIHS